MKEVDGHGIGSAMRRKQAVGLSLIGGKERTKRRRLQVHG
jgi:hypothetical protein